MHTDCGQKKRRRGRTGGSTSSKRAFRPLDAQSRRRTVDTPLLAHRPPSSRSTTARASYGSAGPLALFRRNQSWTYVPTGAGIVGPESLGVFLLGTVGVPSPREGTARWIVGFKGYGIIGSHVEMTTGLGGAVGARGENNVGCSSGLYKGDAWGHDPSPHPGRSPDRSWTFNDVAMDSWRHV